MTNLALIFMGYLDQKGIRYKASEDNDGDSVIRLSYSGDNFSSQDFVFFFSSDSNHISLKGFSVCKVPEAKMIPMLKAINKINSEYRWVKYYISADNEVTISGDAVVDNDTVGEECYELLVRFVNIHDDVFNDIMRALYA